MGKLIVQQIQGSSTDPVLTLPTVDPTGTQLVQTDISGNLSFTSSPSVTNLTAAKVITPLIASTSVSSTFTLPTADGTSGQVMTTNGSGVLGFSTISSSLYGTTNPTTSTAANAGTPYMNTYTGEVFVCQGTRVVSGSPIYMWGGLAGTNVGIPQGQQVYGTYNSGTGSNSFVVPDGVYQISAVLVGGGGGGIGGGSRASGSGGALAYATFPTTPGETLTVVVGAGGAQNTAGGDTYIQRGETTLFTAKGGPTGGTTGSTTRAAPTSGTITCYGGAGGLSYGGGAGGGGAGGYGGTTTGLDAIGGDGQYGTPSYDGSGNMAPSGMSYTAGQGSNGAGGGGVGYQSSTYGFGGGGGVGIYGRGSNGNVGTNPCGNTIGTVSMVTCGGYGGSNGEKGGGNYSSSYTLNGRTMYGGQGGWPGGGGAGGGTSWGSGNPYCNGANGAARLIWGLSSRQYPNFVPDLSTIV